MKISRRTCCFAAIVVLGVIPFAALGQEYFFSGNDKGIWIVRCDEKEKTFDLIARKIGTSPRVVVASPEYLVKHGRPKKPVDLVKHNCLIYSLQKTPDHWYFNSTQEGEESVHVSGLLKASSPDAVCDATIQGLGISVNCEWFVRPYIKQGKLKVILEDYHPSAYDIHAVYPERRFVPQKVKRMIDFLAKKLDSNKKKQRS